MDFTQKLENILKQKPELTNEAIEEIKNFYVNIRGGGDIDNEEELKPVPIK